MFDDFKNLRLPGKSGIVELFSGAAMQRGGIAAPEQGERWTISEYRGGK